ncbi:MAG: enoyl-CoA hydratase-related protein [Blastocatellia bacterium]
MTTEFKNITYQNNSSIGLIIIKQEILLNKLSSATITELKQAFTLSKEDKLVKVVILASGIDQVFIDDIDSTELLPLSPQATQKYSQQGQELTLLIEQLGKPTIASINGLTTGAGLELAIACSLRIAADNALFGMPAIKDQQIGAFGGSRRLAQLIGMGRSLEMLLTGDLITVQRAYEIGLVNQITTLSELRNKTQALAQKISNHCPITVKYLLESFFNGLEMPQQEALFLESTLFGLCNAK